MNYLTKLTVCILLCGFTYGTVILPLNTCEQYDDWKCTPSFECLSPIESPVESTNGGNFEEQCPINEGVCCHIDNIVRDIPSPPLTIYEPSCGQRNEFGLGGENTHAKDSETQFGEFPWMVAVLAYDESKIPLYLGGGSLIAPNVVLTAAHKVKGKFTSSIWIRAGEWKTMYQNEPLPHQQVNVESCITHPKFNKENLNNDFALLVTKTPVTFGPHIGTVCLPSADDMYFRDYTNCFASGWGQDTFKGKNQNVLKKVELDLVRRKSCQKALRSTRLGKRYRLDKSFTCAGGKAGVDTCRGDAGSPLVCTKGDGGAYVQVGIVAWGIGCGEKGIPGVYVDVVKGINWINEELEKIKEGNYKYEEAVVA